MDMWQAQVSPADGVESLFLRPQEDFSGADRSASPLPSTSSVSEQVPASGGLPGSWWASAMPINDDNKGRNDDGHVHANSEEANKIAFAGQSRTDKGMAIVCF